MTRKVVTTLEDIAHGSHIVEDDRNDEGDGVADKVGNAEEFRERDHQTVVDEERQHTHDAEFHELSNEFLQADPSHPARTKADRLSLIVAISPKVVQA